MQARGLNKVGDRQQTRPSGTAEARYETEMPEQKPTKSGNGVDREGKCTRHWGEGGPAETSQEAQRLQK